jgi:hypothetical protein
VTVDSKGRITSATVNAIPTASGSTAGLLSAEAFAAFTNKGSGSVTGVSITSANGFAGTVSTASTTPAISISTSVTGMLKGNGTGISAATAGTDYSAGTASLATGIVKSTTSTGALTIAVAGTDYLTPTGSAASLTNFPTLNQNTTGTAANVSGTVAIANGGTGATTAAAARTSLGAASLDSPTFTGTPTLPTGTIATTQTAGNNSTAIATTAFVAAANGTNANLTGPITSIGNATSVASQTGTGSKFVMDTSPTLVTPTLGVATATSVNKVTLTAPATAATLTIANNKTLTANNSLILAGTDGTTMTFPGSSASVARTDAAQTFTGVQTFSSTIAGNITGNAATVTTNANMSGDVTSSGSNVTTLAATTVTAGSYGSATSVPTFTVDSKGRITSASNTTISGVSAVGSSLASSKILVGNASDLAAAVAMSGDVTISNTGATTVGKIGGKDVSLAGNLTTTGAFATTLTTTAATSVTLPTTGTLATTSDITNALENVSLTLGAAGTSNGNGIRLESGRVIINKPSSPVTKSSSSGLTLTATEILDAGIISLTGTNSRTFTFPSAASIITALPSAKVGDTFTVVLNNQTADKVLTLSPGSGITNYGRTTIDNNSSSSQKTIIYTFRLTNVTSGSEAISIY